MTEEATIELDQSVSDEAEMEPKITRGWKGFDTDFKCRNHQYEVGKTYKIGMRPELCECGFHACLTPVDVLAYYGAACSRFAEVELIGEIVTHKDGQGDSKVAASEIRIVREISYFELWQAHRAWVAEQELEASAAGDSGHASAAGYRGHASAAGDRGHASAAGDSGHASAAGDRGHASAAGYRGHASAAGDRGHASAAGYSGHASATGDRGHASATGKNAIAASLGIESRAKASAGNWIVLAAYGGRKDNWPLLCVKTAKCGDGEGDIKPDVWYQLNASGEFIECDEAQP